MGRIIDLARSVIPACDVTIKQVTAIARETSDLDKVGAYKIGVSFLDMGLSDVVEIIKNFTEKPVIYDHQKAGTDIHEKTPQEFMDAMVRAGIDAVILFPQSGPVSEYEWILAAQERGLGVIFGGEMTHPRYLDNDISEGKTKNYSQIFADLGISRPLPGFIRSTAPEDMYELAARMGVTDFVMPGNKPARISQYKALVERCGVVLPSIYSPGLITQGGDLKEGAAAAGESFHAIVGRDIFYNTAEERNRKPKEMRAAVLDLTSKL